MVDLLQGIHVFFLFRTAIAISSDPAVLTKYGLGPAVGAEDSEMQIPGHHLNLQNPKLWG